jgi:hypothetical protein
VDHAGAVRAGVLEARPCGNGMLRRYIGKMTGLSRAQETRLIGRYQEGELCGSEATVGTGFPIVIQPAISSCCTRTCACVRGGNRRPIGFKISSSPGN